MGLMKKLTSAVVTSSLVLGAVSTAFAAPAADEVNAAYARLNHYNVVQGIAMPDGTVSPALEQNITRAQLITIVTRAFGQEENAKLLRGANTGYSDVDGNADVEWATGYIFMGQRIAAQKGITIGLPGGVFAPSKNVSQIEALAFIMKFLGIEVGTGDTWVETTIANAKAAGLITDAEVQKYLDNANAAANRGHVFGLLDNIFSSYNKLEGGKTVYTSYVDTSAPELNITAPALSTDKESIEIIGSVKGEFSALYVGSEKIAANADGSFSYLAPLNVGANAITFTVVDRAGNSDEATFSVTRSAGVAAKITASLASTIVAGSAADLSFEITDANGVALEVPATDVTVVTSAGTYADGKYTASEKAGTATVTVSYGDLAPVTLDITVTAGALANVTADKTSVDKGETIQLTATDKFGNAIASGVTYTWEGTGIAVTNAGVVYTSAPGKYTVTAKAGEATATTTIGVYGAVSALSVSAPESITANSSTKETVTVTALDEFGNKVSNFDEKNIKLEGVGISVFNADGTAATNSTVQTEDGVATFQISMDKALAGEAVVLTATYDVVDADDVTATATVTADAPVASGLKVVTGAPKFLAANQSGTATVGVEVVDQEGVTFVGTYEVAATVTGPATLVGEETAIFTGTAVDFTVTNAGSIGVEADINLSFAVEGVGSASHTIKQAIAGNPAKLVVTTDEDKVSLKSTETFTFNVEVQDRNGVPVALYNGGSVNLTLTLPDGAPLTTTGGVLAAGSSTASFTLATTDAEPFTGNVAVGVKAEANGYSLTSSKTVSFVAGDAADVKIDRTADIEAPVSAPTGKYTFSVVDAKGNAVAKSGVELTVYGFQVVNGVNTATDYLTINGQKTSTKVTTDATGTATVELAARPYSNYRYAVVAESEVGNSETGYLSIKDAVVSSISTKLVKKVGDSFIPATTVNADEDFYLIATVTDNYGGRVTNLDPATLAPVADEVLGTADFNFTNTYSFGAYNSVAGLAEAVGLEAGDYVATITAAKAGIVSVGVKYTGTQNEISKSSTISVKAGEFASIAVNGGEIAAIEAGKVSSGYTVQLADVFGNAVYSNTSKTITWTITDSLGADASDRVTLRSSASGATITSLTTKASATVYVVATEGDETYTITFSSGAATGEFTVEVE